MDSIKVLAISDSKRNGTHFDKPEIESKSLVVIKDGKPMDIVTARWYKASRGSTIYCSIWVKHDDWVSGQGKATGYGWDKMSGALADALNSAGVKLNQNISGSGRVDATLYAIGEFKGFDREFSLIV